MTVITPVLAANPIQWILDHVPQVLFILFFVAPTLAQIFKKKREAKREVADDDEDEEDLQHVPPQPSGPTQARVPVPAAPDEDLEQRVRRYFEQITGQKVPEPEPVSRPHPVHDPDPVPLRRAQEALTTHKDPESAMTASAAQRVHSVFAPTGLTHVEGEVEFDARVHHGDVAPQVEVTRRYANVSNATRLLDLYEPHALRRAIVLREVLGPPLALREHADV